MDINIKKIESDNRFQDSRPKVREISVNIGTGTPKMLFYWQAVSRWALILFAALAPVFFLPLTQLPVAAHKELLVFTLILIAFFAFLGRVLVEGRIRYPGHFLMIALLVLVLIWGASTFFSLNLITSLIGGWAAPSSFFSILLFSLMMLSIVMTFDRRDIVASLLVFLASLSILGVFELLQLAGVFILPFEFAKNAGFNPIGSVNNIGVLLAFGLVIASGLMSAPEMSGMLKRLLGLAVLIFALNLITIDFWAIWIGLALAMVFMISFLSAGLGDNASTEINVGTGTEYQGLQLAYFQKAWLPSVVLLASLIFLFIPSPLAKFIQTPPEVSPTFSATWDISLASLSAGGGSVFGGKALLGSGPDTFGYIFNLHKPSGINQTIFWSTVFTSGASAMTSWLGTVGILGVLALVFLIVAFVWTGITGTAIRNSSRGIMNVASQSIFVGVCFLFMMWFLYVVDFTTMAFTFWGMGLFLAASLFFMKETYPNPPLSGRLGGVFREIRIFTSPPKVFLFSLMIVGLMVLTIMGAYFETNRYIAEVYFSQAKHTEAIKFWQYDEKYFQGLSQSIFMKLNDLLANKDIPQEEARARFQTITTDSIAAARQAQTLNPQNPFNSVLLGNIYENLIPFIADSSGFALSSYSSAVALDPENPSNYLALARVQIAKEDLDSAVASLEKSLQLKNDYAPSRFLLVQIYDRQGKLTEAIKRAEELVSLNINDVGSLFQLGFLYYKGNQLAQAQPVFERVIQLSPNYSNAMYFLGLIYDGSTSLTASEAKAKALEQFNKIAELNPDNAEIKQIIANLTAKKPALFGITPPNPAPQNRTEVPVSEGATAPVQKIQK